MNVSELNTYQFLQTKPYSFPKQNHEAYKKRKRKKLEQDNRKS